MERKTFGSMMFHARKSLDISQKEFAKKLGVNFTYISKLENDHADYPASINLIKKICQLLNLDENEMLSLSGRIETEDKQAISNLMIKHPKFRELIHKMSRDESFATEIINQL